MYKGNSPKSVNFQVGKNNFLEVFSSFFFFLEIHYWDVPEAKNAVQPNSKTKWRGAESFEISMTRLMEFHSGTWKISQIDGIPLFWYLKNQPDWWNSIDQVPTWKISHQIKSKMDRLGRVHRGAELPEAHIRESRKIKLQFSWPRPIEPRDENINNYI